MDKQEIIIASKNENKVREIGQILNNSALDIVSLNMFSRISDIEETGATFLENALLKAHHYHNILNRPVISDDSGLVVPSLDGEPGIYSARYAGVHSNYERNNEKLLSKMQNLDGELRRAYFICVAVYYDSKTEIQAEGRVYGEITRFALGNNGFGYDPVFYHPESNMTFAQMDPGLKNSISHRYLALQDLKKKLDRYWNN
jgi:XTP/dITP diphosphohydrolase